MDVIRMLPGLLLAGAACGAMLLVFVKRVHAAGADVAHPVYPVSLSGEEVEAAARRVASLMEVPEADMVALVPDRTGFRFMGCPDCDEGTQEGQLTWSVEDPHRVRCRFCGMVYPNEKYPEDRVMRLMNPTGQEVEYPYWEDATGYRYFFSARAWREARTYFSSMAERLAILYQATGDRAYARRSVLILDAFARYYPGFLVSRDWPHRPKGFALEPPYPSGGGKWGRWQADEIPTDCVYAYDRVLDSGEVERLSKETGADVAKRIEEDFFRGAVRQDALHGVAYHNASPRIYEGLAAIGRVLGDPGLVHDAVRRSRGIYERRFFEDGFWCEGSVGYHRMTMEGMRRVFTALRGYSDPEGYVDPVDGEHFQDLDLERDIAIIGRALRIDAIFRYPDGRMLPVHDCKAQAYGDEAPPPPGSMLFPGVGHAWLGLGAGANVVQAHLHFSGSYGHEHADNLSVSLFAKGKELYSDLGYTHTRYRSWTAATLGHNTVLIDEAQQYRRGDRGSSDGCLTAFETAYPGVQWLEARGERGYPELAEEYRRTLVMVQAGEDDAYLVDLFRVTGGSSHDWVIHGSADEDSEARVDLPVTSYGEHMLKGVKVRFPDGEADPGDAGGRNVSYAFFQSVSQGRMDDRVEATFAVRDSDVGVRLHLRTDPGAEVFLGDAPSIRRAEENDALLDRFRMPVFMVRRKGRAPLASRFAAIHEPYTGDPFVESVEVERPSGGGDGVLVRVRHHGVTDHIVHRGAGGTGGVSAGGLHLRGEMGFVRERDGVPVMMGLWGGTELRFGGRTLAGSGTYEAPLAGVLREAEGAAYDALVLERELPPGLAPEGALALVVLGDGTTRGYRVRRAEPAAGRTHLVLADEPGIALAEGGAKHVFFPGREIPGSVLVRVRAAAFAEFGG